MGDWICQSYTSISPPPLKNLRLETCESQIYVTITRDDEPLVFPRDESCTWIRKIRFEFHLINNGYEYEKLKKNEYEASTLKMGIGMCTSLGMGMCTSLGIPISWPNFFCKLR